MKNEKKLLYNNRIIFVLAILGTIMAVYVLQGWLKQSAVVCLTSGCETVRKSSFSYPFGIPVPLFGLIGYAGMVVLAFLRTTSKNLKLFYGIMGIAIFGICFVSWFTFMEVFFIKGICMWCAISAINMWVIFYFVIKSKKLLKKENENHR